MTKTQFKNELLEMLEDDEMMKQGHDDEIIYIVDDIVVYGGFDYGVRSIDHNTFLFDGMTWDQILEWGTLVVPETKSYISNQNVERFVMLGYERLSLTHNHIMGY